MSIYKYLLLVIVLIFYSNNESYCAATFSKNLPKTKSNTKTNQKNITKKTKLEMEDILADDIEDIHSRDPGKNFKLVAIYIIGNKPRVLLKDITKPEVPAKEYLVGDFLDDEQTITISKINFNPTARIEITDESGISYLLKPQNSEDQKNTTSNTMSLPTYFSSGKNKIKRANPYNNAPSEVIKKEETKKEEIKKEESKDESKSENKDGALKTNQEAPSPSPSDSNKTQPTMIESTRPTNAFE